MNDYPVPRKMEFERGGDRGGSVVLKLISTFSANQADRGRQEGGFDGEGGGGHHHATKDFGAGGQKEKCGDVKRGRNPERSYYLLIVTVFSLPAGGIITRILRVVSSNRYANSIKSTHLIPATRVVIRVTENRGKLKK